jgi:hypothetical protein
MTIHRTRPPENDYEMVAKWTAMPLPLETEIKHRKEQQLMLRQLRVRMCKVTSTHIKDDAPDGLDLGRRPPRFYWQPALHLLMAISISYKHGKED